MNKLKNILNDITNGWAFLYTATYGIVAFVLGGYVTILNHPTQSFFITQIISSISMTGIISIFSAIQISLINEKNRSLNIRLICLALILCTIGHAIFDFSSGSGINFILYLTLGIPITLLFFIIPFCILIILDIRHKILPPKYKFKYKIIPLFFRFTI